MSNVNYQIFSDVEWLYPDSKITSAGGNAVLHSARGADVCFQVLTDTILFGDEKFSFELFGFDFPIKIYRLLPAHVSRNSAATSFTTDDYESVKHFVTRKAPFDIYEITEEIGNSLSAGRLALFVRIDIPSDSKSGENKGGLKITVGEESFIVPIDLTVYKATVPPLHDAKFHMVNWLYYDILAKQHNVEPYSDKYMVILEKYLENQLDMKNDYLMLPSGEPIKDAEGNIVDFDFAKAETVGNLAIRKGFNYIMGGFVAHWKHWSEPGLYTLASEKSVDVSSIEGYRELKLYFRRAYESVLRCGWEKNYMQCLVDEPQFANAAAYRSLSGICRQNMPGIKINDPVETTEIGGALDVWVVKQAIYEKYLADFRKIQATGEEMWIYTCGFPAGATMNRIMDLPLTASRLPMWMCFKYDCPGFLHWGYHFAPNEPYEGLMDGCTPTASGKYPPGNAHVVYPGKDDVLYSVRGHAQRTGAADFELLTLLAEKDKDLALSLVDELCRTFDDYESSAEKFNEVREKLLKALG